MAFTREFIRNAAKESGVEIPKEFEDALVREHISVRDAYATSQVKIALDENKPEPTPKVEETPEYKALKKEFDTYKGDVKAKETRLAKEKAYLSLLKTASVDKNFHGRALEGASNDINSIELDEDGNVKNADKLIEKIKTKWSDCIINVSEKGADTPNPPTNTANTFESMSLAEKMEFANKNPEAEEVKNWLKN